MGGLPPWTFISWCTDDAAAAAAAAVAVAVAAAAPLLRHAAALGSQSYADCAVWVRRKNFQAFTWL